MEIQFLKLQYIKISVKSVKNSKIQPLRLSDTTAQPIRRFNRETKAPKLGGQRARRRGSSSRLSWALVSDTHLGRSVLCRVQEILGLKND